MRASLARAADNIRLHARPHARPHARLHARRLKPKYNLLENSLGTLRAKDSHCGPVDTGRHSSHFVHDRPTHLLLHSLSFLVETGQVPHK